jgi:hypothetical protein
MPSTARRSCRVVALPLLVVAAMLLYAPSAYGQEQEPGVMLVPGMQVLGATITGPSLDEPRELGAQEAFEFMQSWLGESIFGNPPNENPPGELGVHEIAVHTTWRDNDLTMLVYYASDGTDAWVGMPPQDVGFATVDAENWIRAPEQTQALMPGISGDTDGDPVTATTTGGATATTDVTGDAAANTSDDDDSILPLVAIAGIAVVVAGVGAFLLGRRRGARSATPTAPEPKP